MAHNQPKPSTQKNGRQAATPKSQGKCSQGIQKQRPQRSIRKSARRKEILHKRKESKDKDTEPKLPFPSPSTSDTLSKEVAPSSHVLPKATDSIDPRPEEFGQPCSQNGHETGRELDPKRKRSQEAEYPTSPVEEEPAAKRARPSLTSCAAENREVASDIQKNVHSIGHWVQEGNWPKGYSNPNYMDLLPRRKKSFASLQDENSEMEVNTSCLGGDGTQAARDPDFDEQLTAAGIYLDEGVATISEDCRKLCGSLLSDKQSVPEICLFQDDLFKTTASRYLHRNEAMVFRDITPLITPSAELLCAFGSTHLAHLREEINTIWTKCICLAGGPRPKPDFAVGFKTSAFTEIELRKLVPYAGGSKETCFIMATKHILFPFLTSEAKCGEVGLAIADRQNANSASVAVNAVVQLYRAVSREQEIDREVQAFSISHDNETVRIYGHYALIQGDRTTFYRHTIKKFDFTSEEGKEKWTAYQFTKNLYDKFAPILLERLKSAIIQLPDPKTFLVSSLSSLPSLDESELPTSPVMPSSAPPPQEAASFKRPRLPPKVMLQQENDQLKERLKQRDDHFMLQINQLMDRQKEQNDQQKEQMDQQMDRQKEQMDRQVDELKKEKDEQRAQIKQLMDLLQQQIPNKQLPQQ